MPEVKDKKIAAKIDELADLSQEMKQLKEKLTEMKNKAKSLENDIRPLLEELSETDQRVLITKKNVAVIERRGYETSSYSYKSAYELALTKVNKSVKKILVTTLAGTKKISQVASNISARPREESMQVEFLDKIKKVVLKIINKVISFITNENKNIDKANMALEKLGKIK